MSGQQERWDGPERTDQPDLRDTTRDLYRLIERVQRQIRADDPGVAAGQHSDSGDRPADGDDDSWDIGRRGAGRSRWPLPADPGPQSPESSPARNGPAADGQSGVHAAPRGPRPGGPRPERGGTERPRSDGPWSGDNLADDRRSDPLRSDYRSDGLPSDGLPPGRPQPSRSWSNGSPADGSRPEGYRPDELWTDRPRPDELRTDRPLPDELWTDRPRPDRPRSDGLDTPPGRSRSEPRRVDPPPQPSEDRHGASTSRSGPSGGVSGAFSTTSRPATSHAHSPSAGDPGLASELRQPSGLRQPSEPGPVGWQSSTSTQDLATVPATAGERSTDRDQAPADERVVSEFPSSQGSESGGYGDYREQPALLSYPAAGREATRREEGADNHDRPAPPGADVRIDHDADRTDQPGDLDRKLGSQDRPGHADTGSTATSDASTAAADTTNTAAGSDTTSTPDSDTTATSIDSTGAATANTRATGSDAGPLSIGTETPATHTETPATPTETPATPTETASHGTGTAGAGSDSGGGPESASTPGPPGEAAVPRSLGADVAIPASPALSAEPEPRDGRGGAPAHLPDAADGRLEHGCLADLRLRLERLPRGHPSSPYHVDGERKPPPPRLRHLELAPPGPDRAPSPWLAAASLPSEARMDANPVSTDRQTPSPPGATDYGAGVPDIGENLNADSGGVGVPGNALRFDWDRRWAVSADPDDDSHLVRTASDNEGAATAPTRDDDGPTNVAPAVQGSASTGHGSRPARLVEASTRAPGPPRIGADGSWTWGSLRLSRDLLRAADDAFDQFREAEGRNMFGGFRTDGLTARVLDIVGSVEHGHIAPGSEQHVLLESEVFRARFADLIRRHPERSPERLARRVPGALSYSLIFDTENYSGGIWIMHDLFEARGFRLLARKNGWGTAENRCVFTVWHDPVSGLPFQVQYHTPASLEAQQLARTSAALIRDPRIPAAEAEHLRSDIASAWAALPAPPGQGAIGDFRRDRGTAAAEDGRVSADQRQSDLRPPDRNTL